MPMTASSFGNKRSSRIFDDPFSFHDVWDPFKGFPLSSSSLAGIDWKETQEAHVFKADLPGLQKDEVKVEIEDGRMLQISGEKKIEKEDKNDIWHRAERGVGKFMRRFKLPENVKMDEVKASMENGVLVVNLPKEEVKKSDVKSIDISG